MADQPEKNPVQPARGFNSVAPEPDPVEPPKAPDAVTEESPEPEGETVVLFIEQAPFYVTSVTLVDSEGGTLVIDRNGTEVSREDEDRLVAEAALSGVALNRK